MSEEIKLSNQRESISDTLTELGYESTILLDGFTYWDDAIIGIADNGAVVYSYKKMVDGYVKEQLEDKYGKDVDIESIDSEEIGELETDAIEFIEYNTIRSLPYMASSGTPPVIMHERGSEIDF